TTGPRWKRSSTPTRPRSGWADPAERRAPERTGGAGHCPGIGNHAEDRAMTETATRVDEAFVRETNEEPEMPGHETALDKQPQWQPRYPGSGRLTDTVAIVTGGDSGIGRATAVLFAREGAKVAIAYLEEDDDAQITADAIAEEGSEALLWRGDLGDPAAGPDLVKQVIDKWGRLDVLVNNAGEQHPDEEVTDITAEQLQRTFQTNIY